MSCDPYKWTCARCGKTHCNPFFTCYPREFEKCRNEIDYDQVRRRKAKAGEAS